jgi:CheY-like chemotaxis protein
VIDVNLLGTMDGWEVAKRAREINPEFPVIYMTGAAADEWAPTAFPTASCSPSHLPPRN